MKKLLLSILSVIVYIVFMQSVVKMYLADVYFTSSQDKLQAGASALALNDANKALALNSREANYYRGRAKIYVYLSSFNDVDITRESKSRALIDMQTAYALNQRNLVTIRNLVPLYYFLAAEDLTKSASDKNIDQTYFNYTKDFYESVQDYSTNDAGVYTLLAKYEKKLGMTEEYAHTHEKVKELRPDLLEWHDAFK